MSDTLEIVDLENLLNDDCHCESREHRTFCSDTVVARLRYSCPGAREPLICQNVVTDVLDFYRSGDICGACWNLISDCWRIVPV